MGKIILLTGGARSGKSTYAKKLALNYGNNVAFIATSPYCDEDMTKRIERHKKDRPHEWKTFEETRELAYLISEIDEFNSFRLAIIDCLTLFVSNHFLDNQNEENILLKIEQMINAIKLSAFDCIIVTNEVGMATHPENAMTRKFIDVLGRVNQIVAQNSDEVYLMVSGLPLKLK